MFKVGNVLDAKETLNARKTNPDISNQGPWFKELKFGRFSKLVLVVDEARDRDC